MATNRLDILKQMVAQNPHDTFSRYGLAMEYRNSGDLETAAQHFQELMATNPDYVPSYFHAGQTLERLGRIEEARAVYRSGLDAAARTGDRHAHAELQGALDLVD